MTDTRFSGSSCLFLTPLASVSSVNDTYQIIPVTNDTSVDDVMLLSLDKFGLDPKDINRYRLVEVSLEKGGQSCVLLLTTSC